jgi:hypothetical protein
VFGTSDKYIIVKNLSGYRRWGGCFDICNGSPSKHGQCFGETDCSSLVSVVLKVKNHLPPHLVW